MDRHDGLAIRVQPNRSRWPDELDACERGTECLSARADVAVDVAQGASERFHGQVVRDHEKIAGTVPRKLRKRVRVGADIATPFRTLGFERYVSADDDAGEIYPVRRELVRLAQPVAVENQACR